MQQGDTARALPEGGHRKPTLTLPLLTQADTHLVPVQSQFLQVLSDNLGDHLTDADGFDALLSGPLSTIDNEAGTVDTLAQSVADAGFVPGAFADSVLTPIAQDTDTFLAAGDTILAGLGLAVAPITVDSPPTEDPVYDVGNGGGDGLLLPDDPTGSQDTFFLENIGFDFG